MSLPVTIPGKTVTIPSQSTELSFKSVSVDKDRKGKLTATIEFYKKNGGTQTITLSGSAYNTFWANWTTGVYLYDQLTAQIPGLQVPDSLEGEFLNPTS